MNAEKRNHIIQAIGHKARSVVPEGTQIVLFGSQARGDAHEDSDWDILILLDKDRIGLNDYDDFAYPLREFGWDIGECINTILYTKEDWQHRSYTPLYKNVMKEGILL